MDVQIFNEVVSIKTPTSVFDVFKLIFARKFLLDLFLYLLMFESVSKNV